MRTERGRAFPHPTAGRSMGGDGVASTTLAQTGAPPPAAAPLVMRKSARSCASSTPTTTGGSIDRTEGGADLACGSATDRPRRHVRPRPRWPGRRSRRPRYAPTSPGRRVRPADVRSGGKAPLYDTGVLRTIFLEFENADWEKELEAFYNTDVEVPATLRSTATCIATWACTSAAPRRSCSFPRARNAR